MNVSQEDEEIDIEAIRAADVTPSVAAVSTHLPVMTPARAATDPPSAMFREPPMSYSYRSGRRSGVVGPASATVAAAGGGAFTSALGAGSGGAAGRNRRASIDGSYLIHPAALLGISGGDSTTARVAFCHHHHQPPPVVGGAYELLSPPPPVMGGAYELLTPPTSSS